MKHVVIDLETLDVTPSSVIAQIGICHLRQVDGVWEAAESYRVDVDIDQPGRTIGASTLRWWVQSAGKDAPFFGGTSLDEALNVVEDEIGGANCVWCNGPAFDFAILEHAFKQADRAFPAKFWTARDCRTAKMVAWDPDLKNETPHDAQADAIFQAKQIAHFLNKIGAE